LPIALQCSGTAWPSQLVAPIRYALSTWAICSTRPSRPTPRFTVSPVAWPSRFKNGWATSVSPASAPPRQANQTNISPARKHPPGPDPPRVVPPDQPVALQRQQQPGRGALGQAGGGGQLGERDRPRRVHDLGEQPCRPVHRLGSASTAHYAPACGRVAVPSFAT